MDTSNSFETLEAPEVRVLGALVEKELSTPEYYPLTLNALTLACNQKSNRHPVVSYDEVQVMTALDGLQSKRLAGRVTGANIRTMKYCHALGTTLGLSKPELTLLASLMLRGPQTVGELRGRTGRMHEFGGIEEVEETLRGLATREAPLVVLLPRQPGKKESRYGHLFSGQPDVEGLMAEAAGPSDERLARLEGEVAALREQVEELRAALEVLRGQPEST